MLSVSVAMATYNGAEYLPDQILSILSNLGPADELIISDDGSTDDTLKIINRFKDKRIKLIKGPGKGIKKNFENAIKHCKNDLILLSDQDDYWKTGKIDRIKEAFQKDPDLTCLVHDCEITDDKLKTLAKSFYRYRESGPGIKKNIFKNTYIGCCMAFKRDMLEFILPIPNDIEMHDQWIGVICEKYGKSAFIKDNLSKYRRHAENNSDLKHYGPVKMFMNRARFIKNYWRRTR